MFLFVRYWRDGYMDYKKEIIEMINGIKKTGTLEYLYTFIKLFLERWGD